MRPFVHFENGSWCITFIRAGETSPVTLIEPDLATAERRACYLAGKQKRRAA